MGLMAFNKYRREAAAAALAIAADVLEAASELLDEASDALETRADTQETTEETVDAGVDHEGAPSVSHAAAALDEMTVRDLRVMARNEGIESPNRLRKDDLIAALLENYAKE